MKSILLGTPNLEAAEVIRGHFGREFKVDLVTTRDACLETFRRKRYEYTFLDISFLEGGPPRDGRIDYGQALQPYWEAYTTAPIIVMSDQAQIRRAVTAVRAGASEYLTYPVDPAEIDFVIDSLSEWRQIESELAHLRENSWRGDLFRGMRTNSPAMKSALDKIKSVAQTKTTVLLTGETGTGKSLMAKVVHGLSHRADGPFIAVHCGAMADTLVESELFGHEKGAFTGAVKRKLGKFEIAQGGTIFLDEIGTVSPAAQIRLLEVLQEKQFSRVGGEIPIEVDVRIVAATNQDLADLCDGGLFRRDLFYRLNVFPIDLPPLRDRTEDVPLLVEGLLGRLNRSYGKNIKGVQAEVMAALTGYYWPGNIRELENIIERAYILENSPVLTVDVVPVELLATRSLPPPGETPAAPLLAEVRRRGLELIERQYLQSILTAHRGRIDRSALAAGLTTRQLHKLMTKHRLRKEDYK
jgi:DNA-binding NtrC family response regulator